MSAAKKLLQISIMALLGASLPLAEAWASVPVLCSLEYNMCCRFCRQSYCIEDTGHPERHCNLGGPILLYWEFDEHCSQSVYDECEAQAQEEYLGQCILIDRSMEPEIPDGIDNNCDGVWLDDELCNGVDDDGNGLVDDSEGSCSLRVLMVPFCWRGAAADFLAKAETQRDFFLRATELSTCAHKYWFEIVSPDDFSLYPSDPCPASFTPSSLLNSLRNSGRYNTAEWDIVEFLTDQDLQGDVAGASDYAGGIWSETHWEGQRIILAHEFGHVLRLDDEYCSVYAGSPGCGNWAGSPNYLGADLGCDPTLSPSDPDACCKAEFRSDTPCAVDDGTPCCGEYRKCCLGNESHTYQPGGRCIMSSVQVLDPELPETNQPRGWCRRCRDYWYQVGPVCGYQFPGVRRIIEAGGWISVDGHVFIDFAGETVGREGRFREERPGAWTVELWENHSGLVRRFGVSKYQSWPRAEAGQASFWTRAPISESASGGSFPILVYEGGVFKSQVTLNGHPAVPVANDVTVECSSPTATRVELDGRDSYDPDGDSIYFQWESSTIVLVDADSELAVGYFPLGIAEVDLKVSDGANGGATKTITVSVVDTTPPNINAPDAFHETCVPDAAEVALEPPEVSDMCTDSVTITVAGFIRKINGHDAGMVALVDGRATLPQGTHVISWVARDLFGNESSTDQTVTVALSAGVGCCGPEQTVLEGTSQADTWRRRDVLGTSSPWCILAYAGADVVHLSGEAGNYLALGDGDDDVKLAFFGTGQNVVLGQEGDDFIRVVAGETVIFGGSGNDQIRVDGGSAVVYGGAGDDFILGSRYDDVIIPGPGRDIVIAGDGDDIVYVYHVCELEANELYIGVPIL